MHTQSAFQLLPPHIVKMIVDRVLGGSRHHFDNGVVMYKKKDKKRSEKKDGEKSDKKGKNVKSKKVRECIKMGNEGNDILMPLLWVCHNFRIFLYARFSSGYELDLRDKKEVAGAALVASRYMWPTRLQGLDAPTHLQARELRIYCFSVSVFTGKALEQLTASALGADGAYPMVRKIMFAMHSSIDLTKFSKESVADAIAHLGAYAAPIRFGQESDGNH
ncbi:hypothetical protein IWW38_005229 [Coemansia aciculifera]|uniref:Uncharacterized protein n=1 Tax=Coemansia aciculifera TaxID=417176 RepID=A0ACC1LVT9_9FUNG|nr:hypothetical protein IWW38_005229 [Coemansia aciculifera]